MPSRVAPRTKPKLSRQVLIWLSRLALAWVVLTVPPVVLLRWVDPPGSAMMLEREHEAKQKGEKGFALKHTWVPLAKISNNAQLAWIAAEDQKFPTHHGFDEQAIEDAIEDHLEGKSSRGASTLSQQVAKNLFLWGGHSWLRKGLEVYFTVLLEACWPKHRILEMHLNIAELGNGVFGVEAASRTFYGKSAAALTLPEAALMAATLPNPRVRRVTAPSPAVEQRAEWIADQARRLGFDTLSGL
jgi:monofunctional biosynthetic peptidoglycan transglycosylase